VSRASKKARKKASKQEQQIKNNKQEQVKNKHSTSKQVQARTGAQALSPE